MYGAKYDSVSKVDAEDPPKFVTKAQVRELVNGIPAVCVTSTALEWMDLTKTWFLPLPLAVS